MFVELSPTILPFAFIFPEKVETPATLRVPDKSKFVNSVVPEVLIPGIDTPDSPEPSPLKEPLKVVPSNVKLALSSSSPPAPAKTIRPEVRSDIFADEAINPEPPDTSTPVGNVDNPALLRVIVPSPTFNSPVTLALPLTNKSVVAPPTITLSLPNVDTPATFRFPNISKFVNSVVPEVVIPGITTSTNPEPSPKNDVAVTELIPDIFVALSPSILPLAVIFPETVSESRRVAAYGLSTTFEFVTTALPIS